MSTSERFNIPCPQCGVLVAVSRAHIGKKGRCPECKTVFPIQEPTAPVPGLTPMKAAPALQPIAPNLQPLAPGLQPLAPGLQPLSPGLQPMPPGLQPMAPGLQPMPPAQQPWPGAPQPAPWPAQQQPGWQNAGIPNPYGQAPPSPFGQPASPFGQPASPYGQPASPYGQPASPYGPPSPFGQPAYGQQQHPSPFDDPSFGRPPKPADDELRLAPDANPYAAPAPISLEETIRRADEKEGWRKDKELSDINGAMWGGLGMMAFAVVLFVVGLLIDVFFCWSPIIFIAGLCSFVGGLVNFFQRR